MEGRSLELKKLSKLSILNRREDNQNILSLFDDIDSIFEKFKKINVESLVGIATEQDCVTKEKDSGKRKMTFSEDIRELEYRLLMFNYFCSKFNLSVSS